MPVYHVAQVNIGQVRAPVEDALMAGFVARLDEVNALADRSPGFVWRLQTPVGNATYFRPYPEDDRILINMSVWESIATLRHYVYKTAHAELLRQRKGQTHGCHYRGRCRTRRNRWSSSRRRQGRGYRDGSGRRCRCRWVCAHREQRHCPSCRICVDIPTFAAYRSETISRRPDSSKIITVSITPSPCSGSGRIQFPLGTGMPASCSISPALKFSRSTAMARSSTGKPGFFRFFIEFCPLMEKR